MRYRQIAHEVNIVLWNGTNTGQLSTALAETSFDFSVTPFQMRVIVESSERDEAISINVGDYLVVYADETLVTIDEQTFNEDFEKRKRVVRWQA